MSTRPSPLPAALDTLARRDLVVLAEERGIAVAPRDNADTIRANLRNKVTQEESAWRREQQRALLAEANLPSFDNGPARAEHALLWGLANLSLDGDTDRAAELAQAAVRFCALVEAHLDGHEAVTADDLRARLGVIRWDAERLAEDRRERNERLQRVGREIAFAAGASVGPLVARTR